ncbi:hypothetical protein [Caldivirga maquilingensis]|uniref:DUF1641 domain-containing protein n=1 Tax=Caldivirga maquilingensis (strain ATCC 700844 / DSM 13496 / JCM 10307 / IC-167) TaxID=397948 RepID=A8MDT5_CALMQ|nr:hypothetical protein [Caldivirga maquilingensis]ABW01941.1 hypothetical protein Cmaq_1113 [Caldivirga maquilingensis IC-167]
MSCNCQCEELKELLEVMRRIEDKLDKAGLSVLADVDLSSTLTLVIKLLTEPKVIDLVDKLTKILNMLSLINPSALVTLTYSLSCMSKSLDNAEILNAPEVTFNDLLKELSKPEYSKALGIVLLILRNVASCIEGDARVKGSGT